MSLRAGCSAFPVAHARYFGALDTLEAGAFAGRLPRPETAERWRSEAPRDFLFSLACDPAVTRNHFRRERAVEAGWERTLAVARALRAAFLLFETPGSFYPQADHLRDLYAFARAAPRDGMLFAWEPSAGWDDGLVRRVCHELRLLHAVDPLARRPAAGAIQYFRLRGGGPGRKPSRGHRYVDAELRHVLAAAEGKPTYAYFLTADMWEDARRLAALAR